ncbi:MAG: hypothetical protein K5639_03240 [Eubacterium sp.]|nr:hypothetical protein [Eubacterium sp.]
MSVLQRIENVIIGILLIAVASILVFVPKESMVLIPLILGITLLAYGLRFLWFYFRMARHMVGGKSFLYEAIIAMDISLFTLSIPAMDNKLFVMIYLLGIYAFTGVVDMLRALEAKEAGSSGWRLKLGRGIGGLIFVVVLVIVGFIIGREDVFVYGYALSLAYSAVMRIIAAFRRTAIVYIQ